MNECIFCEEIANHKFRNKSICENCVEKIKLIFKHPETNVDQIKIEKQNKNSAPMIIELKRVND